MTRLLLRERALENISQGISVSDYTIPGAPIIYTNPAFATMTRYSVDEIIGRGFISFFDEDIARRIRERFDKAYAEKRPLRMETPFKRKDSTIFLDSISSSLITDQDGAITHAVTIHEDVTEIRQREELLLAAQKMESVGQLTGG